MGFQHPSQRDHKLAGMAAAAKSAKTPEHLRAHLQRLTTDVEVPLGGKMKDLSDWKVINEEDSGLQKGERVKLPNGKAGKIVYSAPGMNVVRVLTDDGQRATFGSRLVARILSTKS